MKTIVITGSSSGIGKATAKYFAEQDWKVAATMRKPENETELNQLENVSLYALDVTDEAFIAKATEQILSDFSTVDVVLNNVGYAAVGPFEAATLEQIKRQFDTNVISLMRAAKAFLPHFRANKAGLFMNVSSIGGRVTFPFISLYHSTKWAVEGFSESLAYELGELGIQVKIIGPGGMDTDFRRGHSASGFFKSQHHSPAGGTDFLLLTPILYGVMVWIKVLGAEEIVLT